jgi:hypothetical protein
LAVLRQKAFASSPFLDSRTRAIPSTNFRRRCSGNALMFESPIDHLTLSTLRISTGWLKKLVNSAFLTGSAMGSKRPPLALSFRRRIAERLCDEGSGNQVIGVEPQGTRFASHQGSDLLESFHLVLGNLGASHFRFEVCDAHL